MKVFAEFVVENGIEYRTKTLLQFGNKWNLIGSIVMKNPGSAFPKSEISNETWNELNQNKLVSNNNQLSEVVDAFKNKPVFLAWRWEYLNINKSFAENIFEYVKTSNFMYLKNDMIDNHFYHPGYINIASKKEDVQNILKSFSQYFS
jgi:hypothetical protein